MNYRKAIITGSIKYIESPLIYPNKDIEVISAVLMDKCKFESGDITKILHDKSSNNEDFLEKIKGTCNIINEDKTNAYDLVLFYFSGHGVYKPLEKMSFIQISDDYFIPVDEIIKTISEVKVKNKYIIIDACQSGGFSLMTPKSKILRQYTYNSEGVYCMFGTTKHQLAFEPTINDVIKRKIGCSFFTHFFAEALNTKSNYIDDTISIRAVDDYASKKTPTYTNFEQIPFSTTEISGYFPFGFWNEKSNLIDISDWDVKKETSKSILSNQEVDIVNYLVDRIKTMFSDNRYFFMLPDEKMLRNLSQPAKDILNEKIDLVNKKFEEKPLINGLISNNEMERYSFLSFILEHSEIEIDLTIKDSDGHTALFEAINNTNYYASYIIELLFIRGYKLSSVEESFLYEEFRKGTSRPEILENIAIAIVCHKLGDKDLIGKLRKIEKVIFSILSFKVKRVIGFKLNHIGLANNFLLYNKSFSLLFIRALKEYNYYDSLKTRAPFVKKEKEILDDIPFQETDYDDLLVIIFPELFIIK